MARVSRRARPQRRGLGPAVPGQVPLRRALWRDAAGAGNLRRYKSRKHLKSWNPQLHLSAFL